MARVKVWLLLAVALVLGTAGLKFAGRSPVTIRDLEGRETLVRVDFGIPVDAGDVRSRLVLESEIPDRPPKVDLEWESPSMAIIKVAELAYPEGQRIEVSVQNARTSVPFLRKSARAFFRRPVAPRVFEVSSPVPSAGPVEIRFNTPIEPQSLRQKVVTEVRGEFRPVKSQAAGRQYYDYSRWLFTPSSRLRNNSSYAIQFQPGLRSLGGVELAAPERRVFRTGPPLKTLSSTPADGEKEVWLRPSISVRFDQELGPNSTLTLSPLGGEAGPDEAGPEGAGPIEGGIKVSGRAIEFTPRDVLLPNRSYRVRARAVTPSGESGETQFTFRTVEMGDRLWVGVSLSGTHRVTVYRGDKVVRQMKASAGKAETPTPPGIYRLSMRGQSFWSPEYGEGAHFWVQFLGDYLFHSVPFDEMGRIKPEEEAKLGGPASHGCVRLNLPDAKWFYTNVPDGTLVVIYE